MDEIKVGDSVRYKNSESHFFKSVWTVVRVEDRGGGGVAYVELLEPFGGYPIGYSATFWLRNLEKTDKVGRRLEVIVIFTEGTPAQTFIEAFKCHNAHLINQYEGFRRQTQYIFRCESAHEGLAKMLIGNAEIKQFTWCWV